MSRVVVILSTVLALLFGTGTFNVACLCGPGEGCDSTTVVASAGHGEQGDIEEACATESNCCCGDTEEPAPVQDEVPGKRMPTKCPCLYWTDVPLTTPESHTGTTLVKRAMELAPILLLEAASTHVVCEAAALIRAGPLGPRDTSVRLQAWHCVWTI